MQMTSPTGLTIDSPITVVLKSLKIKIFPMMTMPDVCNAETYLAIILEAILIPTSHITMLLKT